MRKWGYLSSFHIPFWVMVLKLSPIFCNFMMTSGRNVSILKQFTYMHLKGLIMHFQKMVFLLCYDLLFWRYYDLKLKNFNFLLSQHLFWHFNLYLIKSGTDPSVNNTIFWKSATRTYRCIYVHRFKRLLAEVNTKLQNTLFWTI